MFLWTRVPQGTFCTLLRSRSTAHASEFAQSLLCLGKFVWLIFYLRIGFDLSLVSCSEFIVIVRISQVYIEKHLGISAGKLILTFAFVPAAELYTRSILHHGFPCMDYFYDSLKRTYRWVSISLGIGIIYLIIDGFPLVLE